MKLLIDGDVIAYQAVFSKDGKTVSGVTDKLDAIMEDIFVACAPYNREFKYSVYLTGTGNFRYDISDIYKANRPKDKPVTLSLSKQYLVDQYNAVVTEGREADDAIATEAASIGFDEVIIVSNDKDFKQLPCLIYNYKKDEWFKVDELGSKYNFWKQVLMGDSVDNIKGLEGVGQKTAEKILKGLTTDDEMFQASLKAYEGDLEALTKTARLVYLQRQENELWSPPKV